MKKEHKDILLGIVGVIILLLVVSFMNTTKINPNRANYTAQTISTTNWHPIVGYWMVGMGGQPVYTIESLLTEFNYDPGTVDTYFDKNTVNAINQFTEDNNLFVRPSRKGIVRGAIRAKMNEYIKQLIQGVDIREE